MTDLLVLIRPLNAQMAPRVAMLHCNIGGFALHRALEFPGKNQ
jgi:hypothetical protein